MTIPPHMVSAIEEHLANHVGPQADSLLFPAKQGTHLRQTNLHWHYSKARKAAGRPDLRWHDLRHTGLTAAAEAGATTAELMSRGGHSTSEMALRYQHAAASRDREIAARLSKAAENG